MRRSAAPSQKGPAPKKAQFVPPFLSTSSNSNTTSPVAKEKLSKTCRSRCVEKSSAPVDAARSTRDVLHLIQSRSADEPAQLSNSSTCTTSTETLSNGLRQFQERPQLFEAIMMPSTDRLNSDSENNSSSVQTSKSVAGHNGSSNDGEAVSRYFSVMWCKVSKKKHKKWEGDAILITKGRTVVLMDMEGKEIGRGCGYKLTELQTLSDGHMLVIGGKQIEVMGTLTEDQYNTGSCFETAGPAQDSVPSSSSSRAGPLSSLVRR